MPIQYEIDPESGWIYTKGTGLLTFDDFSRNFAAQIADECIGKGVSQIYDLCEVTGIDVSPEDLKKIAEAVKGQQSRFGETKLAIVANRQFLFGLSRMYEVLVEDSSMQAQVFWRLEDAQEWLSEELD